MKISNLDDFNSPILELEQYSTQGNLAARWIRLAKDMGDITTGCTVADIGCGTGVLGLGALFCGASKAIMIDIDQSALDIVYDNAGSAGLTENVEIICSDVAAVTLEHTDLILCNPPWGTQKMGADAPFLEVIRNTGVPSYLLHSSGAKHVAARFHSWGWDVHEMFSEHFDLGSAHTHHTRRRVTTQASLWRLLPPDATSPDRS
jgi:putative methylase